MTIPIPLQEALRDSITSGTFVNTKFWVFSGRSSKAGCVGEPKALFVNGHVAKRVPRLGSLLDGRETRENLRARFPADIKPYTNDYDYEDDSDLEDDDEEGILDGAEPEDASPVVAGKPGNNSDVVNVGNPDAKSTDERSDPDVISEPSDTKGAGSEPGSSSSAHVGRVIVIRDVAFVTFQALLRYLYTNEIEFAPWGSVERREARAREKISESYGIPRPSPKSIYRLADKYDIPELKQLALRRIQQDLSKCDITEEVFSKYTSWYPELRELELRQLAREVLSSDLSPTLWLLRGKIRSYNDGELPHAEHILPALYELMESDESVRETPLPTPEPSAEQEATGGDWEGLKKALTSSLTNGTFLDSQFYAVESRSSTGSPKIRSVYFCSAVGGRFMSKLTAYSSKLRGRKTLPPGSVDGYDSDVDDEESDIQGSPARYPCWMCVRENPTRADLPMEPVLLLKSGAAKTWSAIFLFVYTGQIRFAPLVSQNVISSKAKEDKGGHPQETRNPPLDSGGPGVSLDAITAEASSPKSIYCLADKVDLTELCDVACEDIESKLDKNNIVQELFSPFTANHRRIREMEHELFQSKLKPSVDGALISNIIRDSSSGGNSHRAAAMELILERSIQGRRKRTSARMMKSTPQQGPAPRLEKNSEEPNTSIPQVQSPTPSPAPQPPSQSSTMATTHLFGFLPVSAKPEASLGSSTLSKSARDVKVARREEPAVDAKANPPPPSEDTVQLVCSKCGTKQSRSHLRTGGGCGPCPGSWVPTMKCVGCGVLRFSDIEACTGCSRKFK